MYKYASMLLLFGLVGIVGSPAYPSAITSLTLEKSTDTGAWTNAPGGIWSTNTGDSLTQLGVRQNGVFLNNPGSGSQLGEINIELVPGLNTFELFGTSIFGASDYYGLALFFDGFATPPGMAVYNANGSGDPFSITGAGTTISGTANGGLFPDVAPGTATYSLPDGSIVELVKFEVLYDQGNDDIVSWGEIGADGNVDVYATLTLRSTTVPAPPAIVLVGSALACLVGVRLSKNGRA